MIRTALMLPLALLAACSQTERYNAAQEAADDNRLAQDGGPRAEDGVGEAALVRPVTIGEDGPGLDACGAYGLVRGLAPGRSAPVRAAPFESAAVKVEVAQDSALHICTRSLDQKWLGVVVAPRSATVTDDAAGNGMAAGGPDCGVSSPVDRKQPYDGPCASGWIRSNVVRLVAG